MVRKWQTLILVIYIASMLIAQNNYIENQIIIKMKPEYSLLTLHVNNIGISITGIGDIDHLNNQFQCTNIKKLYRGPNENAVGLYIFRFNADIINENIVNLYSQIPSIEFVELDFILILGQTLPNDWNANYETGLAQMKAPEGWDINTGSPNVIIASNDTGVDYVHPDLGANIWQNLGEDADGDGKVLQQTEIGEWEFDPDDINGIDDDNNGYNDDFVGWDFAFDDNNPSPANGSNNSHGTQTSGTAIQVGDNNIDGVGVSWNSKVMVTNMYDYGVSLSAAIAGIYYSIDNEAHIINMSWGGTGWYSQLHTALTAAYDSNLVLVAAAMHTGDGGTTEKYYPAAWDFVMGVTAVNLDDSKQDIVQYGDWVSVSAPRFDYSTIWDPSGPNEHTVGYYGGATSTAAPYTSGLAALILSELPNATNQMVYSIIENSTDDISEANADSAWENLMGTGRINVQRALSLADGPPATPQNFSVTGNEGDFPTCSWSANIEPDLNGYKLYKNEAGTGWALFRTLDKNTTSYTDRSITIGSGGKFSDDVCYKVSAFDIMGQESPYSISRCKPIGGVNKQMMDLDIIPDKYALHTAFPNPFNPSTSIRFDLPERSRVTMVIYDVLGREITTLINNTIEPGFNEIRWDGKDTNGNPVSTGMYIYRFSAFSEESQTQFNKSSKLVLIK